MGRIEIWKRYIMATYFSSVKGGLYDSRLNISLDIKRYEQGALCRLDMSTLNSDIALGEYRHDSIINYLVHDKTLYFTIPSVVGNMPVIAVGGLISHAYSNLMYNYDIDVIDCSQSCFENIIMADKMFEGLSGDVRLILPTGDHSLKPVTTINMFSDSKITNINDVICSIDFSNIYQVNQMFAGLKCDELDLSDIEFKNVEDLTMMFYKFQGEHIKFNKNAFPNATSADSMFKMCPRLEEVSIGCLHYNKILSAKDMFFQCRRLKRIYADWDKFLDEGEGWALYSTDSISNMFLYSHDLEEIGVEKLIDLLVRTYPWDIRGHFSALGNLDLFLSCYRLDWLSKYTPYSFGSINDADFKSELYAYVISGFMPNIINIAGIKTQGGSRILEYATVKKYREINGLPNYIPDIIIVDSEQYASESSLYDNMTENTEVVMSTMESLESTISKLKMFSGADQKVVIVLTDI